MSRSLLAALLVSLLAVGSVAGCVKSSNTHPTEAEQEKAIAEHNAKAEPGDKLVCRRERVTGSNMKQKVCRYARDKDKESEQAQHEMRRRNLPEPGGLE